MIISLVANMIYALLNVLFVFELPQFPQGVVNVFNSVTSSIDTGLDVLHALLGSGCMSVLGICLQFVIYANLAYFTISVIFFVLKKIPFLGLGD